MASIRKQLEMDPYKAADTRVLLLAPTKKDGEITCRILSESGVHCLPLRNLHELSREIASGVGAVLLTDEVFKAEGLEELRHALDNQPPWSEIPIVMMMPGALESPGAQGMMDSLRNVIMLERPTLMRSLVSAMQGAIRGRIRQYQIRDQIDAVRRAELNARELQQQLELAVEASELGTFHCEFPSGKIFWNDRCKTHFWLGPDVEDVDFDLFYSLLHPDDRERTRHAVEAALNQGAAYDIEYRVVSPEGLVRWVRATGRVYRDLYGRPERFDGTTRDITKDRRAADERRELLDGERTARQEAERISRVKDEFLATLSHELRTPLNAIFGWTQVLKSGKDDPETLSHALGVIDRNVRLQTQLIEDLLDVSRIISGKVRLSMQTVDLQELVATAMDSARPAAEAKGIQLEGTVDSGEAHVSADVGRLHQVIWNLLTNAIKFTDKGGRVQVAVGRVNYDVEISVSDTGQGIRTDFLPYLFARFSQADSSTQRKHGGLGLGLSIVKSLVEMHGGTVRATSPGEGRGATFTVTLPLRVRDGSELDPHPRLPAAAQGFGAPVTLRGIKVLVIDDEADARELIRRLLVSCQADPVIAESAAEALQLVARFTPDVIVSDIGMPGQDGYAFLHALRKQGVNAPAVAVTAFARPEDRIRSIQAGYHAHLPKPFEPIELLTLIASLSQNQGQAKVES